MDLLDSFDHLAHADVLLGRLKKAFTELSRKQGFKSEKEWLGEALELLTAARENGGELLARSLSLEALAPAREDFARTQQQAAVDAVERLEAGLTFHGGKRSPLLEALYANLKLPALRRAPRQDFEKFAADFEKRLNGGYVKRMLADGSLDFAKAAVAQVRAALQAYRTTFSPPALPAEDALALERELRAAASRVELPMRQARLLAEAALAPLKGAWETSGLAQKPKRRASRAAPPAVEEVPAPEPTPPMPPVEAPAPAKPKRKKAKSP